jgi:WD40-like Beta Propeller Repeat
MMSDKKENVPAAGWTTRPGMGARISLPRNTRTCSLLCCFVVLALIFANAARQGSGAIVKSTTEPEVFAPGVISGGAHDSAPAFTPDGKTVYFSRSNGDLSLIVESHRKKEKWSPPVLAPFSGRWNDMEPSMSPDGKFLIFVSSRPTHPGGSPIDGHFNKRTWPGGGGNLWRVDKTTKGWSTPVRLPDLINKTTSTFAPSVVGDGSVYFMESNEETGRFRIYRAQWRNGGFEAPVPAGFSNGDWSSVDPAVAADESYAVFSSSRPPAKDMDLFINFRCGAVWSNPTHLGDVVNSPTSDAEARFSPDGQTLYFSSERRIKAEQPLSEKTSRQVLKDFEWNNGLYNIWQVSLKPWLEGHPSARCAQGFGSSK